MKNRTANGWMASSAFSAAAIAVMMLCGCATPQRQTYDVNVYIQRVDGEGVKIYEGWKEDSFWNGNERGNHYVIWYEYSPNEGKTVGLHFIGGKYDKRSAKSWIDGILDNIVKKANNTENMHRVYVTDTDSLATLRLK